MGPWLQKVNVSSNSMRILWYFAIQIWVRRKRPNLVHMYRIWKCGKSLRQISLCASFSTAVFKCAFRWQQNSILLSKYNFLSFLPPWQESPHFVRKLWGLFSLRKNLSNTYCGSCCQMLTFDDKRGEGVWKPSKHAYVIHGCSLIS